MSNNKPETLLAHLGKDSYSSFGTVNPPVYRASTVLFSTVADMEAAVRSFDRPRYGRAGTPTSNAIEEAITALEGGHRAVVTSSGLAAITTSLLAYVRAGDHILMVDTTYGPTRQFCDGTLKRLGVETEYYDPRIGGGIAALIRPNTRLIYLESPGSLTFEVQDVPAIVAAAKAAGVVTLMDNTWATPLFHRPLSLGVDVVIHAATKYLVGHSDAMLGVIVGTEESFPIIKQASYELGDWAGSEEAWLGLRGIRTLSVRMRRHQDSGLAVARWLQARPEVARVIHPALPEHPDHAIWRRDFDGASGLFGVELKPVSRSAVAAMLDGMELFGMGFSWGGYESLMIPSHVKGSRTAVPWTAEGPLLRLHIGLEDVDDLLRDIEAGFDRLRNAS